SPILSLHGREARGDDRTDARDRDETPGNGVRLGPSDDLGLEPGDPQVERGELRGEASQRLARARGKALIALIGNHGSQFVDLLKATRRDDSEFRQVARKALTRMVRCRTKRSRTVCATSAACCSAVLTSTKRMEGRRTASQTASASAASCLLRF